MRIDGEKIVFANEKGEKDIKIKFSESLHKDEIKRSNHCSKPRTRHINDNREEGRQTKAEFFQPRTE